MNRDRSVEARISEWLREEAPGELPDRVLRATFVRTRAARQHRSVRGWRSLPMFRFSPMAIAVGAVAIAVVAVGVALLPRSNQSVGIAPAPSVSPSPSPSPSGPGASFGITLDRAGSRVGHDSAEWFYMQTPTSDGGWSEGLLLFRDPLLPVADPICPDSADPSRPHAASDLIAYLANNPGLVSSEPVDVTIGGLSGKSVDVSLSAGATSETCVTYAIEASTPPKYFWSVSLGEVQRVAILDAGKGHVFAVVINGHTESRFNKIAPVVVPILESLTFNDQP